MYLNPFVVPPTLQIPPGFKGLDRTREVTQYRRYLPHFRQTGATYFLTFRLADAVPADVVQEMDAQTEAWKRRLAAYSNPQAAPLPTALRDEYEDYLRRLAIRTEQIMDAGLGACWFQDTTLRAVVADALLHFDKVRLEMHAFTVMPNHVHVLFKPGEGYEPEDLASSWKRYTALNLNRIIGCAGQFWQAESWDRIVRNQDHFRTIVRYIARNPMQAHLTPSQASVWIRPSLVRPEMPGMVTEDMGDYAIDPW